MTTVLCKTCGSEFRVTADRVGTAKHCSMACRGAGKKHTGVCVCCGKTFERYKSANNRMAYCSFTCFTKTVAKPETPHVDKRVSPEHYFKTCEVCGTSFRVTYTRRDKARFCSRTCQGKSESWREECSVRQRGEKGWRWTGGLYPTRGGYVRRKRKELDNEVATFEHRNVMLDWILAEAPTHPFLVQESGEWALAKGIEVHHIDLNRSNNIRENLLAVTMKAHAQIHHRNKKPEPWQCWPSNPQVWLRRKE